MIVLIALASAACTAITPGDAMQNAAEVYCRDLGFDTVESTGPDGEPLLYCLFPDGSNCEIMDFFYGDCAPERSVCTLMGLAFDHGTSLDGRTRYASCVFTDGTACTAFDYALLGEKCARVREVNACEDLPGGLCP